MTRFTAEYGQRVRSARAAAGLTQTELGERLNLTRSSVANVEAGRQAATAEQVIQTAEAVGCDPRWLLTGTGRATRIQTVGIPSRIVAGHIAALRSLAERLERAGPP